MQKEQLIEYLKTHATITLTAERDDLSIHGNAIDSGDNEFDAKVEKDIIERLNSGDVWAWACVCVKAEFNDFEGVDYLGGCSYKGQDDFVDDFYYDDMVSSALSELADNIIACKTLLKCIEADLNLQQVFSERGQV